MAYSESISPVQLPLIPLSKACSRCRIEQPLDAFHRNRVTRDGHCAWCKACGHVMAQKRYAANAETIRAQRRAWYRANQDTARSNAREYARAHPEQVKARRRLYNARTRSVVIADRKARYHGSIERYRAAARAWQRAHRAERRVAERESYQRYPWKKLARAELYRARKMGAEGSYTSADVERLYEEQGGRCAYCDQELHRQFDIDHRIPLSRGGSNWPTNLALACEFCNSSKRDLTDHEFMARRRSGTL